jgi:glucose-6-phosphate 1-dehydrogenase
MSFRYATTFGSNTPEAYERLVLDAMIGDGTLFIRGDEAETSWKLCTPMLDYWAACRPHGHGQLSRRLVGTGRAAEALLAATLNRASEANHLWRQP